jgi:hypothetical protein
MPFYMQPMLGSADDLRGYRPYRFRGDNAMVMNAEYRWEVFSGLDMALFADAGKVFPHKSDFDLHHLESDAGFGFRFNARNKTFLRLDVGFSHEGFQVWVKFSNIFQGTDTSAAGDLNADSQQTIDLIAGERWLWELRTADLKTRQKFYSDDPVWSMPRPVAVDKVTYRPLSDYYDFFENSLSHPGERASKGTFLPSQGINTMDEAPDSAWYTNRHASRRMSLEELRKGAGDSNPPAPGAWTVIAAKNEGVTPGFRVKDGAGRKYLIKFDPPSNRKWPARLT